MFKVTASTYRKVGVSNPLVVNGFCDPLKSGALHNHFYFILSKHNYCLRVDAKSGKQKQCTVKKEMLQTTLVSIRSPRFSELFAQGGYKVLKEVY